jgi:uncharacterized radical SAM superfamily protein
MIEREPFRVQERTLELLTSIDMRALIVLGLVPPPGANPMMMDTTRVIQFISRAVDRLSAPVILGCMRPRSDRTLDVRAIEAGASGVVNPSGAADEWALEHGLTIERNETCCAVHL